MESVTLLGALSHVLRELRPESPRKKTTNTVLIPAPDYQFTYFIIKLWWFYGSMRFSFQAGIILFPVDSLVERGLPPVSFTWGNPSLLEWFCRPIPSIVSYCACPFPYMSCLWIHPSMKTEPILFPPQKWIDTHNIGWQRASLNLFQLLSNLQVLVVEDSSYQDISLTLNRKGFIASIQSIAHFGLNLYDRDLNKTPTCNQRKSEEEFGMLNMLN